MAENDTYVQVQPNSTGAKVDCTLLDNGNVRQTVTIGDPAQSASVAAVLNGTLAAADVLDVGIGSPDNAGFVAIVGDPNGDFAGVNLLESLMDNASGLSLGVHVLNQPKLGPDGGLLLTDGKPIVFAGSATAVNIVDTLGYQTINFNLGTGATIATIQGSNDLVNWSFINSYGLGNSIVSGVSWNANTAGVIPVVCRYVRFNMSGAGVLSIFLRTGPLSPAVFAPTLIQPANISQINGATVLTGGTNGSLGIGGLAAAGALASGNPLIGAGVDYKSIVRNLATDIYGSLVLSGWRLPLQPDTKTTNPLPAFTPPPPVKVSLTDDSPGPDTPGLLDSLRLMTAVLMSIDRRLQDLPAKIANSQIDADDFNASDSLSSIN